MCVMGYESGENGLKQPENARGSRLAIIRKLGFFERAATREKTEMGPGYRVPGTRLLVRSGTSELRMLLDLMHWMEVQKSSQEPRCYRPRP